MRQAHAEGRVITDPQRLQLLFAESRQEAQRRSRPILASAVLPVPSIDPLAFFARGGLAHNRILWMSRDSSYSLAGIGAAWTLVTQGAHRFAAAASAWHDLCTGARVDTPANVPQTGPVLLGGFSFDPLRPATQLWEGYPDGLLVLPRLLLTSVEGATWLTINVVLGPGSDVERELLAVLDDCARLLADAGNALESSQKASIAALEDVMSAADWKGIVGEAAQNLHQLGLEKVVLARSSRVRMTADIDPVAVLRQLRASYPECYVFAVARGDRCFLGASPEQLVALRSHELSAMCLAGSIARGNTTEEDKRLGDALLASAKNRSEHAIVVRAMRESLRSLGVDLAAIGEPTLLKVRNVQHLLTKLTGRVAPNQTVLDLVAALHPTPAVGGYPRAAALQLIREREGLDRGWYAGPIGWLDAQGNGEFAVALRSALLYGSEALLFAGCGVVAESDPESEYAESCLKLRPILSALEGATR
jgi:isochorismate synthase